MSSTTSYSIHRSISTRSSIL